MGPKECYYYVYHKHSGHLLGRFKFFAELMPFLLLIIFPVEVGSNRNFGHIRKLESNNICWMQQINRREIRGEWHICSMPWQFDWCCWRFGVFPEPMGTLKWSFYLCTHVSWRSGWNLWGPSWMMFLLKLEIVSQMWWWVVVRNCFWGGTWSRIRIRLIWAIQSKTWIWDFR